MEIEKEATTWIGLERLTKKQVMLIMRALDMAYESLENGNGKDEIKELESKLEQCLHWSRYTDSGKLEWYEQASSALVFLTLGLRTKRQIHSP